MYMYCKLLIGFLLLASVDTLGQGTPLNVYRSSPAVTVNDAHLKGYLSLSIPVVADTAHGLNGGLDSLGLVIQIRSTGDWYKRDTTPGGHKWTKFGSGGSTDTTALSARIDLKVDSIRRKIGSDSVFWYAAGTKVFAFRDSIGAGSSFDSLVSQGGGFHTQPYNDVRYLKRADSATSYVTPKRLADSMAAVRLADSAVISGTFTKKTVVGTTIIIDVDTGKLATDTIQGVNGIKVTRAANVTTIAGDSLLRKDDSVGNTGFRSVGSANKTRDSLGVLIGLKADKTITLTVGSGGSPQDLSASRVFLPNVPNADATNASNITAGTLPTARIGANSIANTQLTQMAAGTIKGNNTGGTANAADLTATQVTAMLDAFTGSVKGLVPTSNGTNPTTEFLRKDGTYAVPAGGSGGTDSSDVVTGGLKKTIVGTTRIYSGDSLLKKANTDLGKLPVIKLKAACVGVTASGTTVTNYPATSVDSVVHFWGATGIGTDFGGVLWSGSSGGDSLYLAGGWFGIIIGNSIAEGHTLLHGLVHPAGVGIYNYAYPDSAGQLSYELRQYTNHRWRNLGIGGQTLAQIRARWGRDILSQVTPNNTDGRGSSTGSRPPNIVILEGGINDVYAGRTAKQIMDDLEWMAASAQANGIYLVLMNLPGDATATQPFLKVISTVNGLLARGYLDKYGVAVYDFNSWWNDPAYGGDNIHHVAAITDDIHPTKAGYADIAPKLAAAVNLPKVVGMVFQNEIAPGGFSGYSRPNGITISGVAATITKSTDTIPISYFINDSIWIKTTSTTNVSGTTNYGFSSIYELIDNNPNNDSYYSPKRFPGGINTNPSFSSVNIVAENANNGLVVFETKAADQLYSHIKVVSNAGGALGYFNGGNSPAQYSSATFNVTGTGFGTNGSFFGLGTNSFFGSISAGYTSTPVTGYGLGIVSSALDMQYGASNALAGNGLRIKKWNIDTPNVSTPNINWGHLFIQSGAGGTLTDRDTINSILIKSPWSVRNTNILPGFVAGLHYQPIVYALGVARHASIWIEGTGENWLGFGRTLIGSTNAGSTGKLDVTDTTQGFIPPRMTTTQRDKMGYISSITITAGGTGYVSYPSFSLTGGSGTGARGFVNVSAGAVTSVQIIDGGTQYFGTPPTPVFGGPGTGATGTAVIHGPDKGTVIYNTTVDSLQYFNGTLWTNIGAGSSLIMGATSAGGATNGADITAGVLTLHEANNTNPGVVSAGAQTFGGVKTFTSSPAVPTPSGSTDAANKAYVDGTNPQLFTQTADATINNTAAQTTIIGTGSGSSTLAANSLTVGKTVRMHGYGYLTTAAVPPTLTMNVGFVSSLSAISVSGLTSTMSSVPMEWDVELTIRSTGSSGTFQITGWVSVNSTKSYIPVSGTGTVNTTITQTADIQATFGTADVNNAILSKIHRLSYQ